MRTNRFGLVIALGVLFVLPINALADGDVFADLSFESACAKADKETALKSRFNVRVLPTVLFVKSDQTEVSRFEGYRSPSEFVEFGGSVLSGDAPPPGGAPGGGGQAAPAPQAVVAKIPMMSGLESDKGYWRWIAMFALAAVVCVSCFKNPKRSHNN